MRNFTIYTGMTGWKNVGALGGFYPDDLPDEWRLSFYTTQFRCVYLPFQAWHDASDEHVAGWLSETQEDFRFVLGGANEVGAGESVMFARFGSRGRLEGGVEGGVNLVWVTPQTGLRELATKIQQTSLSGQELYLIAEEEGFAQLRQVGELMGVMGV